MPGRNQERKINETVPVPDNMIQHITITCCFYSEAAKGTSEMSSQQGVLAPASAATKPC